MTPIIPDQQTWASTVGLFILNFGSLDFLVLDYLEAHLSAEEFARWKDRHFAERVERVRNHIQQAGSSTVRREQFEQWSSRLEPIREIRNHIAHGLLRLSLAEDNKTLRITISLPRDLDRSDPPTALHLTFEEFSQASQELTALIEDFKWWCGGWITDAIIRC